MTNVLHEHLFQELDDEVAATCNAGAAKLYRDDGFGPNPPKTFNLGTKNLRGFNFNDQTSSLVIDEPWVFYEHINFTGKAVILGRGSYNTSQLAARGIRNDSISSLRNASIRPDNPVFG